MVTLYNIEHIKYNENQSFVRGELRGLSTDEKPKKINGAKIDNGSVFIEIDTQKIYFFDAENQEWIGE